MFCPQARFRHLSMLGMHSEFHVLRKEGFRLPQRCATQTEPDAYSHNTHSRTPSEEEKNFAYFDKCGKANMLGGVDGNR